MADYTILTNSEKKNRSNVVIEFPVPATDNDAGVPWRTIVAEVRDGTGSVNPRKASDATYIALLDAGQIVEVLLSVEYDANLSNGEKVTVLDAAVAAKVTEFTVEFASLYEFYGTERPVGGG